MPVSTYLFFNGNCAEGRPALPRLGGAPRVEPKLDARQRSWLSGYLAGSLELAGAPGKVISVDVSHAALQLRVETEGSLGNRVRLRACLVKYLSARSSTG